MDKEKTLNEITVLEREIRQWKDKSETDPDRQSAAAARLDLRRVERKYKDLLLQGRAIHNAEAAFTPKRQ